MAHTQSALRKHCRVQRLCDQSGNSILKVKNKEFKTRAGDLFLCRYRAGLHFFSTTTAKKQGDTGKEVLCLYERNSSIAQFLSDFHSLRGPLIRSLFIFSLQWGLKQLNNIELKLNSKPYGVHHQSADDGYSWAKKYRLLFKPAKWIE